MKINEAFPSKYLAADDIPEEGLIVEVKKVTYELIGQGNEATEKFVVTFTDPSVKTFICNKTNANTLHKITGSDDSDDWVGARIRLIALEVQGPKGMVMAIRISPKAPQVAKPVQKQASKVTDPEVSEDEVPF